MKIEIFTRIENTGLEDRHCLYIKGFHNQEVKIAEITEWKKNNDKELKQTIKSIASLLKKLE